MDTGFRRYDGTFVPIRRPDNTCTYIFNGDTKVTKLSCGRRTPCSDHSLIPFLRSLYSLRLISPISFCALCITIVQNLWCVRN